MKKLITLLFIILCVCGCSDKNMLNIENNDKDQSTNIQTNGEKYQPTMPGSEENIKANIDVKVVRATSNECVVFITNNNTFVIPDIEITLKFYKNGQIVDVAEDGHDVLLPGRTVVSSLKSHEDFSEIKYDLEVEWGNSYKNHSDDVEIKGTLNSYNEVIVEITNNSSVDIEEIEYIVVFYDSNNQIIGTSGCNDIDDVEKGKTITKKTYISNYKYIKDIESFKIYLNQAHTF